MSAPQYAAELLLDYSLASPSLRDAHPAASAAQLSAGARAVLACLGAFDAHAARGVGMARRRLLWAAACGGGLGRRSPARRLAPDLVELVGILLWIAPS